MKKENSQKIKRKDMTPEQKKKKNLKNLLITACVIGALILLFGSFSLAGFIGVSVNLKKVKSFEEIGSSLTPVLDSETGYWTFTTDNDFKVLHLTDIHIGGGAFSIKKDSWALDAVYTLIKNEKPDLVIVTGDIAYPVPYQAGTFNNKREARLFAELMEKTGVYWALAFGNHDSEIYSMYDRAEISEFYSQEKWAHCLFQSGPKDIDGFGNYFINVKNTKGLITQSLIMFDSHSYTDGDYFGIEWKYDNIHQNQVDWYSREITSLSNKNITVFSGMTNEEKEAYASSVGMTVPDYGAKGTFKSCAFFHIPLVEYKDAYNEYIKANSGNTADVFFNFGEAGETGPVVYSGIGEDQLFETMLTLGSTQGIFCGHDHLNNFSIKYKGINLTYGMSIDYLAYSGIYKMTEQRGGTLITYSPNGNMKIEQRRLSDY